MLFDRGWSLCVLAHYDALGLQPSVFFLSFATAAFSIRRVNTCASVMPVRSWAFLPVVLQLPTPWAVPVAAAGNVPEVPAGRLALVLALAQPPTACIAFH